VLSDALVGQSDTAAIVLRSMVGYDEGIKIEMEFLLRNPGPDRRPLRTALDTQLADPAMSFGWDTEGEFQPIKWTVVGAHNVSTLSTEEGISRLTIKTWVTPPPDELVVGARWLTHDIQAVHLRVDCRHAPGSWSMPLWPDSPDQTPDQAQ
jgi:hypothetical protein